MLNVYKLPSDLTNPFLEIHLKELKSLRQSDGCAPVFVAAKYRNCLPRGTGNQKETGVAGCSGVSFRNNKNVLKFIVVMGAQVSGYTKTCWIVYCLWLNCTAHELP